MQFLPDEVMLKIVGYLSLYSMCLLSSICREYRNLCSGKEVWFPLFARKGLSKPETRFSFASWLDVYQRSLMGKIGAKYVLTLYSKEYKPWLSLIRPVPLSALHEAMWKDILEPLKDELPKSREKRYLSLSKRNKEYLCTIEDDNHRVLSILAVNKKTVYNILYRLFYRGICEVDKHVYQEF